MVTVPKLYVKVRTMSIVLKKECWIIRSKKGITRYHGDSFSDIYIKREEAQEPGEGECPAEEAGS